MTIYIYLINGHTYTDFKSAYKVLSSIVFSSKGWDSCGDILSQLGGNTTKHLANVATNMVNSGAIWHDADDILKWLPYNAKEYVDYVLKTYYEDVLKEDKIRAKYGLN